MAQHLRGCFFFFFFGGGGGGFRVWGLGFRVWGLGLGGCCAHASREVWDRLESSLGSNVLLGWSWRAFGLPKGEV